MDWKHSTEIFAFSTSLFFFLSLAISYGLILKWLLFCLITLMKFSYLPLLLGNTTVDELMMRLMAAMEIFSAQQQEDIKDEVSIGSCCSYLLASANHWGHKLTLRCFFSQWSWLCCVVVSLPLSEIKKEVSFVYLFGSLKTTPPFWSCHFQFLSFFWTLVTCDCLHHSDIMELNMLTQGNNNQIFSHWPAPSHR